jgi:iron complex transport system permease protein
MAFSIAIGLALGLALLLDVGMGEAEVSRLVTPGVVVRVLLNHLPALGFHLPLPPGADSIVWEVRLPRTLGGALVGTMLALAGVAFQSLLMNPLADPYTVGVASGAALGSFAVLLLGGATWMGGAAQPLAAFGAGLLAVAIVYLLACVGGRISAQSFLLAGVIVGSFFWAFIPLIVTLSGRADQDRQVFTTLFGSLQPIGWPQALLLLPFCLVGGAALWYAAPELDLMAQGEETAAHFGVDVERFKRRVVVIGTLLTAAAVAAAGIIAFVGFVTPHLARRILGPKHGALLPAAGLLGALGLVLADWLSRVFLHNVEIGVITSLLGAPIFCAMLRRRLTANT